MDDVSMEVTLPQDTIDSLCGYVEHTIYCSRACSDDEMRKHREECRSYACEVMVRLIKANPGLMLHPAVARRKEVIEWVRAGQVGRRPDE